MSNAEYVRVRIGLVPEPLAGLHVHVRVAEHLVGDFDLHFVDSDTGHGVVRDIKVAREGAQLLELNFVDYCALLEGQ